MEKTRGEILVLLDTNEEEIKNNPEMKKAVDILQNGRSPYIVIRYFAIKHESAMGVIDHLISRMVEDGIDILPPEEK
jgi:hypothetical protein